MKDLCWQWAGSGGLHNWEVSQSLYSPIKPISDSQIYFVILAWKGSWREVISNSFLLNTCHVALFLLRRSLQWWKPRVGMLITHLHIFFSLCRSPEPALVSSCRSIFTSPPHYPSFKYRPLLRCSFFKIFICLSPVLLFLPTSSFLSACFPPIFPSLSCLLTIWITCHAPNELFTVIYALNNGCDRCWLKKSVINNT